MARTADPSGEDADRSAGELDDEVDRTELRNRYYGLLQELRVLLPGVQVLVAFLLTAPFANRFPKLDRTGRTLYGVSLMTGMIAIVAFITPIAMHRVGRRESRSVRLQWSIRMIRAGLLLLATSLFTSLLLIGRFVYSDPVAAALAGIFTASIVLAWIVLPDSAGRRSRT
jgi:hypothetical protein